jgi:hypothetical protein
MIGGTETADPRQSPPGCKRRGGYVLMLEFDQATYEDLKDPPRLESHW